MDDADFTARFVSEVTAAQPKMRSYIAKLVANASSVDDILQESNRVLWEKREDWQEGTVFLKWAYRVCYFRVKSWRRDHAREKLVFSDDLLETFALEEPGNDLMSRREEGLKNCLKKLSGDQHEAVMRYYDPSVSVSELARERKLAPNTLAQQLRRIRQRLHLCIESYLERTEA